MNKSKTNKSGFGQYFTPKEIAEFMVELADITADAKILEPSCGEGVFIDVLQNKGYKNIRAFEIDKTLVTKYPFVCNESFISARIINKFQLIIGNPPYIRWKNLDKKLKDELAFDPDWQKHCNSLCDYLNIFIIKSIDLLCDKGQLIFICPEYWMSTTHSKNLRNYMVDNGYFAEIYHFNESPIFAGVRSSIVIFKYVKGKEKTSQIRVTKNTSRLKHTEKILINMRNRESLENVEFFKIPQFKPHQRWILQSSDIQEKLGALESACCKPLLRYEVKDKEAEIQRYVSLGEVCDIGNGLVSGLDRAFVISDFNLNNEEKNSSITVIKAKNLQPFLSEGHSKYIFIEEGLNEGELKIKYPNFYRHLQKFRGDLEVRYQYNRKINYWEWVLLRNFSLFKKPQKRIFVPCKERISHKDYFRFALIERDIFPTQDVTAIFIKPNVKESIEYVLAYLNQKEVFDWLKCNGIVKGGVVEFSEKPLASVPFKKINWDKEREVYLHDYISELTKEYLIHKNKKILLTIREQFKELLYNKKQHIICK